MEDLDLRMIVAALIMFVGVALNGLSKFLKAPILLCFLGLGIACGKHGLDIFRHWNVQDVQSLGELALCFIIFTGGLQTSFKAIKKVFVTGTILATVGVVLTAFVCAGFEYYLSNRIGTFFSMSFPLALLACSVFASTDAAAVFAILRGQKASINPRLQALLEYESGSNDPAAFLLTTVMISVVNSGVTSLDPGNILWTITSGIVWGLGMGSLVGVALGIFGQWFYNRIQSFLEYNGLRLVLAVAVVLFCFGVTSYIFHANVLMACYIAGITMGNMRFNFKQTFTKFHDGISWLMQFSLFTVLGAFFDYRMLYNGRNILGALLTSVVLMFVARPLVVMLCTIKSPFTWKERLFTGWVGIRGSAPIMLAFMVLAKVDTNIVPQQMLSNFFYIVFTVVLISILLQGSTIMWAAKILGLKLPYEEKGESLLEYDERSDGREITLFTVAKENRLIGVYLREIDFGDDAILLMIQRGKNFIQPNPDIVLCEGDMLSFLGKRESMQGVHDLYFPQEDYSPMLTFKQLWKKFMPKKDSYSNKSKKSE